MPVARYQLPDGRVARFEVPEGTTPEQAQQIGADYFKQQPETTQPAIAETQPVSEIDPQSGRMTEAEFQQDVDTARAPYQQAGNVANEFATGAHRSLASMIDFLGPDRFNDILRAVGSDYQMPTASASVPAKGAYDQSLVGKIAGTAGEIIPAAAMIGQGLRTAASRLPQMTQASESAAAGTLRQLGTSKPIQDVTGASLAAAGQETGREIGGETGALIGSVAAPIAGAAAFATLKNQASSLIKKASPSIDELKATASKLYQAIDDSGVTIGADKYSALVDDIARTIKKGGADPDLTPKALAVVKRLQSEAGTPKTLTELDTLRKVAKAAADSADKAESRLGVIAINKIDDFMDDIGGDVIANKEAGEAFRTARDLWGRARRSEILDLAVTNAQNQASGFENGIRTQFRQVLKRIDSGKLKGFSEEEKQAIRKVVQGTTAGNVARFLGKFGILDGITSRSLTTLGGAGLAGAAGGAPAAAAVPLIGQVSGALAERMTLNNAKMAQSIVQAGRNFNKITSVYMQNTPAGQRNAQELASLFIQNKVPIESINLTKAKPIIADAAIYSAIAQMTDKKEGDE